MSITLDSIFRDHMVIQRERKIRIFGTGQTGEKAEVSLAGKKGFGQAAEDGTWEVILEPLEAGGPYELEVKTEEKTMIVKDILIGDVYVAAGQSNMEFLFENTAYAESEREHASQAAFRYYKVPQVEYQKDGKEYPEIPEEGWYECSPENVGKISGVAYYCVKELRRHTDVPIGVVGCHKGGTSASCWVSEETLKKDPEIKKIYYDDYWKDIKDQSEEEEDLAIHQYQEILAAYQKKVEEYQKQYPDRSMSQLKHDVGHTPWPGPKGKKDYGRPCGLYETMFQKIRGMRYKAILWYQGEEDTKAASVYKILLLNLIDNWRRDLDDKELPFLIMQLPNYNDDKIPFSWAVLREQQRQAVKESEHTYLICTLGFGEEFNIHPADKSEAGRRLGLMAAEVFYDKQVQGCAPELSKVERTEDGYCLTFDSCYGRILSAGNSDQDLQISYDGKHFEKIKAETAQEDLLIKTQRDVKVICYDWENNPEVVFTGASGLPIIPFYYEI